MRDVCVSNRGLSGESEWSYYPSQPNQPNQPIQSSWEAEFGVAVVGVSASMPSHSNELSLAFMESTLFEVLGGKLSAKQVSLTQEGKEKGEERSVPMSESASSLSLSLECDALQAMVAPQLVRFGVEFFELLGEAATRALHAPMSSMYGQNQDQNQKPGVEVSLSAVHVLVVVLTEPLDHTSHPIAPIDPIDPTVSGGSLVLCLEDAHMHVHVSVQRQGSHTHTHRLWCGSGSLHANPTSGQPADIAHLITHQGAGKKEGNGKEGKSNLKLCPLVYMNRHPPYSLSPLPHTLDGDTDSSEGATNIRGKTEGWALEVNLDLSGQAGVVDVVAGLLQERAVDMRAQSVTVCDALSEWVPVLQRICLDCQPSYVSHLPQPSPEEDGGLSGSYTADSEGVCGFKCSISVRCGRILVRRLSECCTHETDKAILSSPAQGGDMIKISVKFLTVSLSALTYALSPH